MMIDEYVILHTKMTDTFDEHVNAIIVSFIPYRLYADLTLTFADVIRLMIARPRMAHIIYSTHKPLLADESKDVADDIISSILFGKKIIPIDYTNRNGVKFIRYLESLESDDFVELINNNPKDINIHRYINNRCAVDGTFIFNHWPMNERYRLAYAYSWTYSSHHEMYLCALTSFSHCYMTMAVKQAYDTCPGFREMIRSTIINTRYVEFAILLKDQELLDMIGAGHYGV